MYRKFALSIGVPAAATILAFVAAPLQAQTTPAVAPPTCASHVNALWGSGSEPGSRVVRAVQHTLHLRDCAVHQVAWACNSPRPPRRDIVPDP